MPKQVKLLWTVSHGNFDNEVNYFDGVRTPTVSYDNAKSENSQSYLSPH